MIIVKFKFKIMNYFHVKFDTFKLFLGISAFLVGSLVTSFIAASGLPMLPIIMCRVAILTTLN